MTRISDVGLVFLLIGALGYSYACCAKRRAFVSQIDFLALMIVGIGHVVASLGGLYVSIATAIIGLGVGLAMGYHICTYQSVNKLDRDF